MKVTVRYKKSLPLTLTEFQNRAVEYGNRVNSPAWFMRMRLGKSIVFLRWVNQNPSLNRILVVCPLRVTETWKDHIEKEGLRFVDLRGLKLPKFRDKIIETMNTREKRIYLINYEFLVKHRELAHFGWDVVCLDESVRIKNPQSNTTKFFLKNFTHVKKKALLSGLPNPQSPLELVCQMIFKNGQFLGCRDYYSFRNKYCTLKDEWTHDWQLTTESRSLLKEAIHDQCFVLSHEEAGFKSEKVFQKRYCTLPDNCRVMYNDVTKNYEYTTETDKVERTNFDLTKSAWLQFIAGGFEPIDKVPVSDHKYHLLSEVLSEVFTEVNHVVVMFKYLHEIRRFEELWQDSIRCSNVELLDVKTFCISSDVSDKEIQERTSNWKNSKRGILASTQRISSVGLDYATASTMIFFSNEWSNDLREQSLERIWNLNKSGLLLYIDLVVSETLEEEIMKTLGERNFDANYILRKNFMQHGGKHGK